MWGNLVVVLALRAEVVVAMALVFGDPVGFGSGSGGVVEAGVSIVRLRE